MKVLENIFSVKNSKDKTHKVVTILSLKMKFKRKRNDIFAKENTEMLKQLISSVEYNKFVLERIQKRLLMLDVPLNYKQYWTDDNFQNIIPLNYGKYPEGFHPGEVVENEILKDIDYNIILDYGCGYGRLTDAFDKEKYIGVDLNPNAIAKAKENNPGYRYLEINMDSTLPECDIAFANAVFLHNDDKMLSSIVTRLKEANCKYIVVSDVISKDWHNGFIPPTYYRSLEEYNKLMEELCFSFVLEKKYVYKRYAEAEEFKHLNTDLSFLLYKRKDL